MLLVGHLLGGSLSTLGLIPWFDARVIEVAWAELILLLDLATCTGAVRWLAGRLTNSIPGGRRNA